MSACPLLEPLRKLIEVHTCRRVGNVSCVTLIKYVGLYGVSMLLVLRSVSSRAGI